MGLFTGREVLNPRPPSRTLMDAVRDNDLDLIDKTLHAGEDVTQTNAYGRTVLHKAAYYSGEPRVIESLIKRGADVNARDRGHWTATHLAARNHHNDAMKLLLDAGAETHWRLEARMDRAAPRGDSGERGGREDAGEGGRGRRLTRQERRGRANPPRGERHRSNLSARRKIT